MLCVVLPTIAAIGAFAWWFREGNEKAQRRPDWTFSGQLEVLVWSVPLLVITFLGGLAWVGSHDLDPAKPLASKGETLEVQVVSLDWKWLFIYPAQNVASVNALVIPAGAPVHFTLTSASVMNAFFIPSLGSMIYTMNGMTTNLNLQADAPGVFLGLSSHFSGDGFPGMHFETRAVSQAEFDTWVDGAKGAGAELDAAAYAALAKQSMDVAPFTYRAVGPELFADIVSQAAPPGPGPAPSPHPKPQPDSKPVASSSPMPMGHPHSHMQAER